MSKFHAQTYNMVAARIREQFPTNPRNDKGLKIIRGTLCELSLSFAETFRRDNELFDPPKFLDACSPDVDRFPISELWQAREDAQNGS